jgi:hypothetical protein
MAVKLVVGDAVSSQQPFVSGCVAAPRLFVRFLLHTQRLRTGLTCSAPPPPRHAQTTRGVGDPGSGASASRCNISRKLTNIPAALSPGASQSRNPACGRGPTPRKHRREAESRSALPQAEPSPVCPPGDIWISLLTLYGENGKNLS